MENSQTAMGNYTTTVATKNSTLHARCYRIGDGWRGIDTVTFAAGMVEKTVHNFIDSFCDLGGRITGADRSQSSLISERFVALRREF